MTQREWQEIFASNLTSILRERGMSQNQLAREAGVSVSRISDYVNKSAVPTIFTAINIAYALDLDVGDLIDFGESIE